MLQHNLSVFTLWQLNHWLNTSNNMKIDIWATGERKVNCTKVNCSNWKLFLSYLQHELHQGKQPSLLSCFFKLHRTDQMGKVSHGFVSSTSADTQEIRCYASKYCPILKIRVLSGKKMILTSWRFNFDCLWVYIIGRTQGFHEALQILSKQCTLGHLNFTFTQCKS